MRRTTRRTLSGLAFAGLILVGLSARGGNVEHFNAIPAQVAPNEEVTFEVSFTPTLGASPTCGARIQYDDGSPPIDFVGGFSTRTFTHAYQNAGSYRPFVEGSLNTQYPPCQVEFAYQGRIALDVTVTAPDSGAPKAERLPPGSEVLSPIRPRPDHAPDTRPLREPPPRAEQAQEPGQYRYRPTIETAVVEPRSDVAPGILAPGGWLILEGKGFGDIGMVQVQGLPGGDLVLTMSSWADTRLEGTVPPDIGSLPGQRFVVTVRVIRLDTNETSAPWSLQYENPAKTLSNPFGGPGPTRGPREGRKREAVRDEPSSPTIQRRAD